MTTHVKIDGRAITYTTEPMSILDQFALAAMQVLLADPNGFKDESRIAGVAYYQAHCMMKERNNY